MVCVSSSDRYLVLIWLERMENSFPNLINSPALFLPLRNQVHNRVENNCSAISISIRKGFLG
jgi:hypothetical protein